jgi:ubiquinone/menaquinone biosynthesis C-methylase UbiE
MADFVVGVVDENGKGASTPLGCVIGVDATPEMIARAREKTTRSGLEVDF